MLRNLNYSVSGQRIIGTYKSGVLGSLIPSTGDNGAGYAYNDLSLLTDATKEICGRITSWPSVGTLTAYEDTSFEYSAPDGTVSSFQYQLYVDGVAVGNPVTVSLQVGSISHSVTGSLSALSAEIAASSARVSGGVSHVSSGAIVARPATIYGYDVAPALTLTTADINAIAQAVLSLMMANTIPVNVVQMNSANVIGTGQIGDDWRGVGVQPQ